MLLLFYTLKHCGHAIKHKFNRSSAIKVEDRRLNRDFVNNLTNEVLDAAKPVTIGGYEHINTHQTDVTEDQSLVFDWNKYRKD